MASIRGYCRALERAAVPYVRSANQRYHSRNYVLPYNPAATTSSTRTGTRW